MQIHSFNDTEGLKIAVEMEKRGEAFYRKAAKLSNNEKTVRILEQLASDEAVHKREFEKLIENASVSDEMYDEETSAYLSAIAADVVFPEGLMALRRVGFSSPEGALREAIQSEKDSILFYTELSAHAYDCEAKRMFQEIIMQERRHLRLLQGRLEELAAEG
jgi:rubrerythrin